MTHLLSIGSMLQAVYIFPKQSSIMLYMILDIKEIVAPASIKALNHFPACTVAVGQSEISPIVNC